MSRHPAPLAVLITFDQWPIAALGCYGNQWVDTSAFDHWAADGFVCDNAIAERLLSDANRDQPAFDAAGLLALVDRGVTLRCWRESAATPLAGIESQLPVTIVPSGDGLPETPSDLPLARLLSAVQSSWGELAHAATPTVVWLHSAGLADDCLPPVSAWDLYAEESGDGVPDWSDVSDADLVVHPAVRAAAVTLMDHWLGEFQQRLQTLACPVLLQVLGLNGEEWLAVERRLSVPGGLAAMRVKLPWIVWEQGENGTPRAWEPGRTAAIVQPGDAIPTIAHWLSSETQAAPSQTALPASTERGLWPLILGETNRHRAWAITQGDDGLASIWTPSEQVIAPEANLDASAAPCDANELSAEFRRYWQPEDPWNMFDTSSDAADRIVEVLQLPQDG